MSGHACSSSRIRGSTASTTDPRGARRYCGGSLSTLLIIGRSTFTCRQGGQFSDAVDNRYYGGDYLGPPPTKDSPKRSPHAMSGPGPLPPRDELTKQFTKHGSDLLIKPRTSTVRPC
jgi:hypothetical protein